MFSNRIAVVAVAAACVVSAGAGSYFATRHNVAGLASPTAVASSTQASPAPAVAPAPAPAPERAPVADIRAASQPAALAAPVATARTDVRTLTQPAARSAAPATPRTTEPVRPAEPVMTAPAIASAASAAAEPPADPQPAPSRIEERLPSEPLQPSMAARSFEELVVAADSVIGLETESMLSSATARLEDRVEARVVRDVRVNGAVAIPAGTRAVGSVVVVEHGGRFKDRARLGIRFQTLLLADGSELPISTETIYRFGSAPGNASAARIGGGAVVGAIIGGIVGGGKGAAIGATAGAGAGTASVMSSDRGEAIFPRGAEMTARILDPITVTVEKD